MYNILNCRGWETEAVGKWLGSAPCIKSRVGFIILFFIIALVRKWGGEKLGIDFSFFMGLLGGILGYFIVITIFGSFKIAFVIGLIAALALGYGGGTIFGGGEE